MLESLKEIEKLTKLSRLFCSDNNLESLEGIENLKNLKILFCNNNNFSNEYEKYLREYCWKNDIEIRI